MLAGRVRWWSHGVSFSVACLFVGVIAISWKGSEETWELMVERILPWMAMCFFACTVGFAVPVPASAATRSHFHLFFSDLPAISERLKVYQPKSLKMRLKLL